MKQSIKLGVVCLARKTFDFEAAAKIFAETKVNLRKLENVELTVVDDLVIEAGDAKAAAETLVAGNVDAVAIISGTFHLGHLALIIDRTVRRPVLLWAFNELPYNGGKIRLNSVCGVNLNASNLYKAGNDTFAFTIADKIDESWVDAIRMKAAIERGNIGLVGFRADGFFNLAVDELRSFRECGLMLNHYEIADLYSQEVMEEEAAEYTEKLNSKFTTARVTREQVEKTARLCVSAKKFMKKNSLTAAAIRCWPEHANGFGIAPCAMMSLLQEEGFTLGCEGDVEASVSMLVNKAIGVETPFLADLSQVNFTEDTALMWHCGVAPANLRDGVCDCSLDTYFAGGRGVTADFVMKPGEVSFLRIDSARGKTRLFMTTGTALPMEKLLRGTYAKVRFAQPVRDVLQKVAFTGIAHHVVMSYGTYTDVYKMFARIMQWEIL